MDFLYCLKGDTYGGKAKEKKMLTVPIYLAGIIDFNFGCESGDFRSEERRGLGS